MLDILFPSFFTSDESLWDDEKYVYQKDTSHFLSADYLNSILIGAVKDQQKSIEKLEEKVKKLEHFIFSHKTMTPSLL